MTSATSVSRAGLPPGRWFATVASMKARMTAASKEAVCDSHSIQA